MQSGLVMEVGMKLDPSLGWGKSVMAASIEGDPGREPWSLPRVVWWLLTSNND